MSRNRTNFSTRQRGYSLAEVLVATAIFTVIFIAALMIYDRSNKVFKQGIESSDMQQSTRVAFDQLAADVRMTGFDFDRDGRPFGLLGVQPWEPDTDYQIGNVIQPDPPNGHAYVVITSGKSGGSPPSWPEGSGDTIDEAGSALEWKEKQILQYQQPDEQLEYMGATAITLRGNLDYESDAAADNGREEDLESEYFPVVTTANDEIVTYALKSQDDSKNTDEIVFFADTFIPRQVHPADGEAEVEVTIEGVDLTNENPPYTLYRYTLKEDGTPDAGTPLADNIRSLNFRYFRDTSGTVEVAPNLGAGQYDGAAPAETVERQARREIRAIRVDLVGMNPQPDGSYTNPDDTVVPNHRTYRLESMIVPRNLGRRGMKELSVDAPGKPTIKVVCMGSCNVAYVTWEPPLKGEVITYNIMSDIDNVGGWDLEDVGNTLEAYVSKYVTSPNMNYYFKVQAINPNGFATSDNEVMIKNINKTKPGPPTAATATGGDDDGATNLPEPNQITVVWPQVTMNEAPLNVLTCSDGSTREQLTIAGGELVAYRLYRSTDPNFTPDPANLVFDENSAIQPVFSGSNLVFTDTTAANCTTYYYRLQAVDTECIANINYNDPASFDTASSSYYPADGLPSTVEGRAESAVAPAKVANVSVLSDSCAGNSNVNCDVKLQWTKVAFDAADPPAPIYVDEYRITVEKFDAITNTWPIEYEDVPVLGGLTEYTFPNLDKTNTYRFFVEAVQCALPGTASDYLYWPCDFTPTVTVSVPTSFGGTGTSAGTPYIINSPANLEVTVSDPVAKIEVWSSAGGAIQTQEGSLTTATFAIPDPPDDVATAIYVNTVLASGCAKLTVFWVEDEAPPPCPTGVITADLPNNVITLTLANTSTVHDLTLEKIRVTWNKAEAPNNTDLDDIFVNGFASSKVSEALASNIYTEVWTPPVGSTMTMGTTGYEVELQFDLPGNNDLAINPVKSICIQYRGQQGDVIVCGFTLPGTVPGVCTIP